MFTFLPWGVSYLEVHGEHICVSLLAPACFCSTLLLENLFGRARPCQCTTPPLARFQIAIYGGMMIMQHSTLILPSAVH